MRIITIRTLWLTAAAVVLLLGLLSVVAYAQGEEPTLEEINAIARDLWCPLCNGVRLDVCELRACDQMRETISDQLREGKSGDDIIAYFVQKYGYVVLGEPPRRGASWLPWLLPFIVLALGSVYLIHLGRRWMQKQPTVGVLASNKSTNPPSDPYIKQVEEDLKRLR